MVKEYMSITDGQSESIKFRHNLNVLLQVNEPFPFFESLGNNILGGFCGGAAASYVVSFLSFLHKKISWIMDLKHETILDRKHETDNPKVFFTNYENTSDARKRRWIIASPFDTDVLVIEWTQRDQ
jgi:hypothetical protein